MSTVEGYDSTFGRVIMDLNNKPSSEKSL